MSIIHIAFYPSDWLAGTRGLSDAETGVYITLIAKMYEMAGPIERDDQRLYRLCGCKSKTSFVKSLDYLISEGMVIDSPDGLFNERVAKEIEIVVTKSIKAKDAAQSRWKRKSNKNNKGLNADAKPEHMPQPCQPEPEPEPDSKKDYADLPTAKSAKSRGSRLSQDWFLPKAWGDWALDQGADPELIRQEAETFKDYWIGKSGKDATKADWLATWRNWMRRAIKNQGGSAKNVKSGGSQSIIRAAATGTTNQDWG